MIRKAQWRPPQLMFMVFLIFVIAGYTAYGRELEGRPDPEGPQQKWQLKFSVGADFIPHPFDGFNIYAQRMISGSRAVRFGMGLRDYDVGRDYKFVNVFPTGEDYYEYDLDYGQTIFSAAVDYVGYFKSKSRIKPYLGIGPFLDITLSDLDRKDWTRGAQTDPRTNEDEREILGTGVNVLFGAEWDLNGRLSLQVEYSLRFTLERYSQSISYNNPDISPQYQRERTTNIDSYRIDADNIKTGLSLAF